MMDIEQIKRDLAEWDAAEYPYQDDLALRRVAAHVLPLLAEVERLHRIEAAARVIYRGDWWEMTEYALERNVELKAGRANREAVIRAILHDALDGAAGAGE